MRVCVVGGGSALAYHVIRHYLIESWDVVAVCRDKEPVVGDLDTARLKIEWAPHWQSGPLDLLITMTGLSQSAKLEETTPREWDEVVEANLGTVATALRCKGQDLVDGGNVVVVGSVIGSTGGYGCSAYAAAKAGLVGLVRAAANEWACKRICVNLLELGYVNCGMGARLPDRVKERVLPTIPLRRFAEPEEVVQAIDYLGKVRYMTGNVLTLAGGLR